MQEDTMSILEEIRCSIKEGRAKDAERLVREALKANVDPEEILNQGMVPAMREVGEQFRREQADIPKVLTAARGMRKGMDILEQYLEMDQRRLTGTVILGTVEGDLHDVGKNLVAIMFRSVGFNVIDLGVDVPEKQFLKAIKEHPECSIVCLSSLLTTATPEMQRVVRAIRKADKKGNMKIMVGGGSVTQEFADEIGADAYTENAMDAAEMAKTFLTGGK